MNNRYFFLTPILVLFSSCDSSNQSITKLGDEKSLRNLVDLGTFSSSIGTLSFTPSIPKSHNEILDEYWERLAETTPTFAGMIYKADLPVIMVKGSDRSVSALKMDADSIIRTQGVQTPTGKYNLQSAKYSFSELNDYKNRIGKLAGEAKIHVVTVDNDEEFNRVYFGVYEASDVIKLKNVLLKSEIPKESYFIDIAPNIVQISSLSDPLRPIRASNRAYFNLNTGQSRCTVGPGFHVKLVNGQRFFGFLLNSHCSDFQFQDQTIYYTDGLGTIGSKYIDPAPYFPNNTFFPWRVADCQNVLSYTPAPKPNGCRWSDAAFVQMSVNTSNSQVNLTTGTDNNDFNIGNPSYKSMQYGGSGADARVGTIVQKVGQTTGWTTSRVSQTCITTIRNVAKPDGTSMNVPIVCQSVSTSINGNPIADGGDSGSGMFATPNSSNVPGNMWVGIVWGKLEVTTSYFSPFDQIDMDIRSDNRVETTGMPSNGGL